MGERFLFIEAFCWTGIYIKSDIFRILLTIKSSGFFLNFIPPHCEWVITLYFLPLLSNCGIPLVNHHSQPSLRNIFTDNSNFETGLEIDNISQKQINSSILCSFPSRHKPKFLNMPVIVKVDCLAPGKIQENGIHLRSAKSRHATEDCMLEITWMGSGQEEIRFSDQWLQSW